MSLCSKKTRRRRGGGDKKIIKGVGRGVGGGGELGWRNKQIVKQIKLGEKMNERNDGLLKNV